MVMTIEADIRPTGRREERRLERRRLILAVAKTSFLENGYAGTTMSEISALLGGSKGTLWSYFSSKEELFAAYLDETTSAFKQELTELLVSSRELRPALEISARRYIEKINSSESIKLYRLVVGESGRFPEVGRMFYERAPGAAEAIIARFLDVHIQEARMRPTDARCAARTFLALCARGGQQQALCGYERPDQKSIFDEAVEIADNFIQIYGI